MNKKTLLATSVGLAFFGTSALAAVGDPADAIGIDWNGDGSGYDDVGALDWAVGSSFSDNSVGIGDWQYTAPDGTVIDLTAQEAAAFTLTNPGTTVECVSNCSFELYTHATLSGYSDSGGLTPPDPDGLNSDFEWTFIGGATEDIGTQSIAIDDTFTDTAAGNDIYEVTSTLSFDMSAAGNTTAEGFFFEIYYDDLTDGTGQQSDTLSGLGYNDGQLILESTELTFIDGDFKTGLFTFEDINDNAMFDLGVDVVLTDANSAWLNLDSFIANDWNDGSAADGAECDTNANAGTDGNCLSVQGTGGTQLETLINEATLADAFWDPSNDPIYFVSDLIFSTQNVDPFLQTNPSGSYDTSAGGTTKDNSFVFGTVINPDGSIPGDVVNGASMLSNCLLLAAGDQPACFAAASAGEDVLFQTDANTSFRTTRNEVPEPGMIALLGLGLGFLGLSRRRTRV